MIRQLTRYAYQNRAGENLNQDNHIIQVFDSLGEFQ